MKKYTRGAPEVKERVINRIKNDGVTIVQAAEEHGGIKIHHPDLDHERGGRTAHPFGEYQGKA